MKLFGNQNFSKQSITAIISAVLCHALLLFAPFQAYAEDPVRVTLDGQPQKGFDRIILTFSKPIPYEVKYTNQIISVQFESEVISSVTKVQSQLSDIVAAARTDPNNKALRLALRKTITLSVKDAAESVYIDLLPTNWSGPNPPLPEEVVADLAKRAREANEKIKAYENKPKAEPETLHVKGLNSRFFSRLIFKNASKLEPTISNDGNNQRIKFAQKNIPDISSVIADLPENILDIKIEQQNDETSILLYLKPNAKIQAFKEEQDYIVDVFSNDGALPMKPSQEKKSEVAPPILPIAEKKSADETTPNIQVQSQSPAPEIKSEPKANIVAQMEPQAKQEEAPKAPRQEAQATQQQLPAKVESENPPPVMHTVEAIPAEQDTTQIESVKVADQARFHFGFQKNTPASVFERNGVLWAIFVSGENIPAIDVFPFKNFISSVENTRQGNILIFKFALNDKFLISVDNQDKSWDIILSNTVIPQNTDLKLLRAEDANGKSIMKFKFPEADQAIQIKDHNAGDDLWVLTALGPAKGMPETQKYLEFDILQSAHGIVLASKVNDLVMNSDIDTVTISRAEGLHISEEKNWQDIKVSNNAHDDLFVQGKSNEWNSPIYDIEKEHFKLASVYKGIELEDKRLKLARHYIARGLGVEAYGVFRVQLKDNPEILQSPNWQNIQLGVFVLLNRAEEALKLIATYKGIEYTPEGAFWQTIAADMLNKYAIVRSSYPVAMNAAAHTSPALKKLFFLAVIRSELEANNFAEVSNMLLEFDSLPKSMFPKQMVMIANGRIAEGYGHFQDAFESYRTALKGGNKNAYYEARFRMAALRNKTNQIPVDEVIADLEKISMAWRGDSTEIQALILLTKLYDQQKKLRLSFATFKRLQEADSIGNDEARKLYDHMTQRFEQIYLGDEADQIAPQEALALYYDFKHLTPVGRKGDEMIRKISDRLVELDLLQPAIELLDHQVRFRLSGSARSQIAAKLALLYLKAKRPGDALKALNETRLPDLPAQLLKARTLLEAKALADVGRSGIALEVLNSLKGDDIDRMKADILWRSKDWMQAGEALEKILGDRWKNSGDLNDQQVADVLRASVAYALANDKIGTFRMRSKYGTLMNRSVEAKSFDVVTTSGDSGNDLQNIARKLNTIDNMEAFLTDYKNRTKEFDSGQESNAKQTQPSKPEVTP